MPALQRDAGIAGNVVKADGYTLVPTESNNLPSHALVQLRDYLHKATLVPGAEMIPKDMELLARMRDPAWDPRKTVLLGSPPEASMVSSGQAVAGSPDNVEVKTYTPTRIELAVQSAQPAYVLINDAYDPDWQVEVNGRPAELLRADYILRAVAVPAGASKVTLHYRAHYHVAGLNLPVAPMNNLSDGAMLAAWMVAIVALWRRQT